MSGSRAVTRWVIFGLLLVTLLVLLAVQGLSTRTTGRSATPVPGSGGPLAGEGPVLAWGPGGLQSRDVAPGKRIALTFDDGPDPHWTPKIASALERLHVPATFFVVGSEVVRHPDLVRQLHRAGFELGNHTFTHADVSTLPGWERNLQVSLTDNALAGTVGVRPRLFRPPYSSVPGGVNVDQARCLREPGPRRVRGRAHRLRRRGLAPPRSGLDRRLGHAPERAGRHRAPARRRRRSLTDGSGHRASRSCVCARAASAS